MCVCCLFSHFSHVQLFAILWTIAHQVSLSMGFSRQEYQRGLTCPSAGGLPDPGIEPMFLAFPALQADSLPLSHEGSLKGGITRNQIANICWIIEIQHKLPIGRLLSSVRSPGEKEEETEGEQLKPRRPGCSYFSSLHSTKTLFSRTRHHLARLFQS